MSLFIYNLSRKSSEKRFIKVMDIEAKKLKEMIERGSTVIDNTKNSNFMVGFEYNPEKKEELISREECHSAD